MKVSNKRFRRVIIIILFVIIICYCFVNASYQMGAHQKLDAINKIATKELAQLNKLNPIHKKYAKKNGMKNPFENRKSFDNQKDSLTTGRILVPIKTNMYYYVSGFSHSVPYLTKASADLLAEIGESFNKELLDYGLQDYRITITSCLRTVEDQKNLKKINSNASETTSHYYGTTFDISYKTFVNVSVFRKILQGFEKLFKTDLLKTSRNKKKFKAVLSRILLKLQKEGKCVVLYEKMQPCFHITVAK